jgi:hypothetical protein
MSAASDLRLKRGFGPDGVKEFFVMTRDGDTIDGGIVAGPFSFRAQADEAMEGLKPLYGAASLTVCGGHLDGWQDRPFDEGELEWDTRL